MAKTGRKAKPTALKLVTGNPGKRPINEKEPEPLRIFEPPAPADFSELETAKWNDLSKKLAACRVLTELDLDALEIYCREWVAMHDALTDLDSRGKLLQTRTGGVMWNPNWSQYKHSQSVCRSIMAEFGMTPSTRTSVVAVGDSKGKNEWSEF
jgi:P27 family predicted phage terminase small subunit